MRFTSFYGTRLKRLSNDNQNDMTNLPSGNYLAALMAGPNSEQHFINTE